MIARQKGEALRECSIYWRTKTFMKMLFRRSEERRYRCLQVEAIDEENGEDLL